MKQIPKVEQGDIYCHSIYCSTYCNFGHYVESGKPVNHECRTIPPTALQAEIDGEYDLAARLMKDAERRKRR